MPFDDSSSDADDAESHVNGHTHTRYDGEDTSATTPRELYGWYAYPIAAEVFAVVAVGMYILFPPKIPRS